MRLALAMKRRKRASMYDTIIQLPVTAKIFIHIIIAVTIFSHIRYKNIYFNYGQIILTMLGIFGCFLGIALGLLEFDTRNIQESVPSLLAGIKTSFWASVFGIGGALTIKTIQKERGRKGPRVDTQQVDE